MSESYGNRCGHDPASLRFCDKVKRGKGGAPQVIGIVSALVGKAALYRNLLKSWQGLNESGKRRSIGEARSYGSGYAVSDSYGL